MRYKRNTDYNCPWEAAVYVGPSEGWHEVKLLGEPRYLDRLTYEVDASHPQTDECPSVGNPPFNHR